MKKHKITFIDTMSPVHAPNSQPKLPEPKPASKHIPEWYAKSERWVGTDNKPNLGNTGKNIGLKTCVPFLDGMTSGYMLELHTDVQITYRKETDQADIAWTSGPDPIAIRSSLVGEKIPRPAGHLFTHYAWIGHWGIKLPKGWSLLVTHPLNRFDLPFTTLSGIMDSDVFFGNGNIPFFLRSNWSGFIEAGTPIAQLIPIKRENWSSELGTVEDKAQVNQQLFDCKRVLEGNYKKNFWNKKRYE